MKPLHLTVSEAYGVSHFAKDAVEIVLKNENAALGMVPGYFLWNLRGKFWSHFHQQQRLFTSKGPLALAEDCFLQSTVTM